jgi:hypothetical protein
MRLGGRSVLTEDRAGGCIVEEHFISNQERTTPIDRRSILRGILGGATVGTVGWAVMPSAMEATQLAIGLSGDFRG